MKLSNRLRTYDIIIAQNRIKSRRIDKMDYWLHVHEQNGEIRAKKEEPIKKARWYQRETNWYECSNCGLLTKQWIKMQYKYCPTCGARMEGVKNDEEGNKTN